MKILFPDTTHINRMEGIEFRQGEVSKDKNPVILPENPWEEIYTYLYGSTLKRGGIYRMWYQSYVDGHGFFVNYARSIDGINWEKPLLKKFCFEKPEVYPTVAINGKIEDFYSKRNGPTGYKTNIVSRYHIPSVVYDAEDRQSPYKLFGYTDKGYCVSFSRDGINFKEHENNPVIPVLRFPNPLTRKTWFSDVAPAFKDTMRNKFVAFVKTYIVDNEGRTRRCVGFSESNDFKTWSTPETIWAPDESEDRIAAARGFKWADFYGLCGFNYGNVYLGFLWLFYIDYEVKRGTHEGKVEVYLACSNDGRNWKRVSDKPFIPLSKDGWDTDMLYTANAPVFLRDKTLIYYSGSNFSHGIGHEETPHDFNNHSFRIGLASLRKDGFVYAHSPNGYLTTKIVTGEKGYLILNLDARKGYILLDIIKDGKCVESFKVGGIDSSNYKIKTGVKGDFTLKILLKDSMLYSFEVR